MKGLAILLMFMLFGCATEEQKIEVYKERCSEFGWSIDSNAYKNCVERLYDSAHW